MPAFPLSCVCFFCLLALVLAREICVASWDPWEEWSACSPLGLSRERHRNCTAKPEPCVLSREMLCEENRSEIQLSSCSPADRLLHDTTAAPPLPICSIVGEWSEWRAWSTCGSRDAEQRRMRHCETVPRACQMGQGFKCDESVKSYHDERFCGDSSVTPRTVTPTRFSSRSPTGTRNSKIPTTMKFTTPSGLFSTLTPSPSPHLPLTTTTAIPAARTTPSISTPSACISMWKEWTAWTACTASCGNCGEKIRYRACEELPDLVEKCKCPARKLQNEREHCESRTCPGAQACCEGHLANAFDENGDVLCVPGDIPKDFDLPPPTDGADSPQIVDFRD